MPDQFSNARAYFDPTFPSSGDGYSIAGYRNAFTALAFIDHLPLQPRAHNPADTKIMIRGRDASSFYNPVYYGDANQRVPFVSGDTAAFSAPAVNPRIDIVYMTPSGDYKIQVGTVAASPTLPTLAPSGDSRTPICAVWNKPSQTKIVNFEDRNSNTGDGYIYQDLRPWLRTAGAGSATLGTSNPIAPTGDGQVGPGVLATAARSDHVHGGVHAIRKVGQTNLQGDIELAGNPSGVLTQGGNRITVNSPFSLSYTSPQQTIAVASQLVLAHGMGTIPLLIQCRLICLSAEAGYSVGDQVIVDNNQNEPANNRGLSVVLDATNITIRFGNGSTSKSFDLIDKTTGASAAITDANWKFIVMAWA